MILITSKLTNSGRVPMQVIDFFIGGNIPYLCEAFVCANCYQITLSNKIYHVTIQSINMQHVLTTNVQ